VNRRNFLSTSLTGAVALAAAAGIPTICQCRMCLLLRSFFLLSSIFFTANGMAGQITGRVITREGKAIPHAVVQVMGVQQVSADRTGHFITKPLTPGEYTLKISHIGFEQKIILNIRISEEPFRDLGDLVMENRIMPLGEMIVSATRVSAPSFVDSAPLNLIPFSRVQERAAKTSAEALREEAGISVQKTNHGGGSAIIRGLSSNQILLLVDGVRLNNSTYRLGNHQYLTTIDPNMLEQIEVVRGPNSVLYGSDALGGTINLVTRTPSFAASGCELTYGLLNRFASADHEKTTAGALSISGKRVAIDLGGSYKNYDDLRRGANSAHQELEKSKNGAVQSPSGFYAYDANGKLVYNPHHQQCWTLAYQSCRQIRVPRYDKYELEDYYRWVYHPQKRDLLYLNFKDHSRIKWLGDVQTFVSWQRQEEGREQQKRMDTDLTVENDIVHTLGASVQFNPVFADHSVMYGVEGYKDFIKSNAYKTIAMSQAMQWQPRGRYPDGSEYTTSGLFIQDQWQIDPYFKVRLGTRFSYFNAHFMGDAQKVVQQFKAYTASLGAVYSVTTFCNLVGNVGQAFRAPNLSDIAKLGESKGNIYEVPNYRLEPEKVLNVDIGFKINARPLKLDCSAYYAKIYDLLASAEASYHGSKTIVLNGIAYRIKSKQNIGQAYIRGLEASFACQIYKKLNFHGNICSTIGHNTTLHEPVGGIPPAFGLFGFKLASERYFLSVYTRFASRQNRLSSDDCDDPRIPVDGTPGWQIFNLRFGGYAFPCCRWRLGVENIFDVNYREHGSGINGPGRNVIISLELGSGPGNK